MKMAIFSVSCTTITIIWMSVLCVFIFFLARLTSVNIIRTKYFRRAIQNIEHPHIASLVWLRFVEIGERS